MWRHFTPCIAGVDVEWPLMKVIMTFTFCCDNLRKSKFMALKSLENSGNFFSYFVATLYTGSGVWRQGAMEDKAAAEYNT